MSDAGLDTPHFEATLATPVFDASLASTSFDAALATPPSLDAFIASIAVFEADLIPGLSVISGECTCDPDVYDLIAVSSWTQLHGRTYFPDVYLIDPTGLRVWISVLYPDPAHVHITFPSPYTGKVLVQ